MIFRIKFQKSVKNFYEYLETPKTLKAFLQNSLFVFVFASFRKPNFYLEDFFVELFILRVFEWNGVFIQTCMQHLQ